MKYAFRADASTLMGTGHVMRCLTLAEALKSKGNEIFFICRDYPGSLIDLIQKKNFSVTVLPFSDKEAYQAQGFNNDYAKWLWVDSNADALECQAVLRSRNTDILIVDDYALDQYWETQLRPFAKKIMVIDDLANRQHDCDILLDQNYYRDLEHRYDMLVPKACIKLLGSRYALIRPDFLDIRKKRESLGKFIPHPIKNILVYMGGSDPKNMTVRILEILLKLPMINSYCVDVVVGISNPYQDQIKNLCAVAGFYYHFQPAYYSDLLVSADLAIAAGGTSTYERCAIGLPTIVIAIAENQLALVRDIGFYGAHIFIDSLNNFKVDSLIRKIYEDLCYYVERMLNLVDSQGLLRVVKELNNDKLTSS